jgi:hypothetical protein
MYNKKVLSEAKRNLNSTKAPAKKKDKIVSKPVVSTQGYKQGPPPTGSHYRIPGNGAGTSIYNPTPYPLNLIGPNGTQAQIGPWDTNTQHFDEPYMDEFPIAAYGGDISIPDLTDYEDGGEYDLTQEEIDDLIAQGYVVEDADEYKKGGTPRALPKKKSSKGYSRSLTATNKLFAQSPLTKKSKSKKNKIFDPNAKYYQDGGISPLEGNYISKVIMNRNRGVDFVDRAFALGANPGTSMFNVPDDEQFGAHMSHKMAYGEGEGGKTWMFPTVLNPNDEAIEVPGQYADYISSEGYKYATGMKQKGGFQDDLGKHRKLLRDWTYGQSIGMLQKAQEGLTTGVVESKTPWANAPEGMSPNVYEGKDITVKAKGPEWARFQREYQNANPWERYLAGEKNKYIRKHKGLNKAAGVTADSFPKDAEERIRQEYDRKMNTYTTRRLGQNFGFNPRKRGEWIDLLTDKEKEIVAGGKYGSKLQPDVWSRFLSGARSTANLLNPTRYKIEGQIPGYTEAENKEALNSWFEPLEMAAPLDLAGIYFANAAKNMNTENPSFLSGEMMGNVDYADVMAANPLTLLDLYALPHLAVSAGRGATKGVKAVGRALGTEEGLLPNTFTRSGLGGMDMSRYEIKNPDYFSQLLDSYTSKQLSPSNKKFYKGLIESVKKQDGLATERQYNELQRLKSGNFDFGSKGYNKGYEEGGVTEEAEYTDVDLTPEEIDWYLANGYDLEDLGDSETFDDYLPEAQTGFVIEGKTNAIPQKKKTAAPTPPPVVTEDVVVSKTPTEKLVIQGKTNIVPKTETRKRVQPPVENAEGYFAKSPYAYQSLSGYMAKNPIVPEQVGLTPYATSLIEGRPHTTLGGIEKPAKKSKPLSAKEQSALEAQIKYKLYGSDDDSEVYGFDLFSGMDELIDTKTQQLKRFLEKKGVVDTKDYKLDPKKTQSKKAPVVAATPKAAKFYQELGTVPDSYDPKHNLLSYRNQWDNKEGFEYIATPVKKDRSGNEEYKNVKGVGHFLLDASVADGKVYKWKDNDAYINRAKKNNEWIPAFTRVNGDRVKLQYKKANELTKKDIVVSPLRQMSYDEIKFDQTQRPEGFQSGIKEVKKSDGQGTYLLFKDRNGYSRFSGGSVVFIFKDQYGNTIVRDYAGSLNGIENEGINIKKEYNLKPGELTIGYHDVGSFSAKPKADAKGNLKSSQWDGFNNNGVTGGALLIPNK